jgi:nucleotide-binding universal stress UspA family protein
METPMQTIQERRAATVDVQPDTFKTLLVHAEPGLSASHRLEVAGCLARDLGACLIGLGAETFDPLDASAPEGAHFAAGLLAAQQEQIEKDLVAAEVAFRRDAGGADLEWRTLQDYPHLALTRMSRAADLILVGPHTGADTTRSADPADVVMGAGRPVLIVPDHLHRLHGKAVVVAWKDTRECRRALADAMPLLTRAEDVIVHTVCKAGTGDAAMAEIDDVIANLKRHGVAARPLVTATAPAGVAREVERVAELNKADLIVCGAYGHSRLREWAFGGVTAELMRRPGCFVLMSH